MASVPSHDRFFLQEADSKTCILIDLPTANRFFRSSQDITQTDPAIGLLRPPTSAIAHRSNRIAIHLLARCDPGEGPSARTTRRLP